MRLFGLILVLFGSLAAATAADAVNGRVIKVLPFLLNTNGVDSTTPSLFDRDAYQLYLRSHTNEIGGYRLDVQWKATKAADENLKLRVELHGVATNSAPTLNTFETNVVAGRFSRWTSFKLDGDAFKQAGSIVAWRATLWNGDQLLGEQKSFLW